MIIAIMLKRIDMSGTQLRKRTHYNSYHALNISRTASIKMPGELQEVNAASVKKAGEEPIVTFLYVPNALMGYA